MNRVLLCAFVSVVSVVSLVSCQMFKKGGDSATWSGQMQNMSEDMRKLIPYMYNRQAYSDPSNEKMISQALGDLSHASHKIPEEMGKKFLGEDPILEYSLDNLQSDLNRAKSSFEKGQKEYSRSVLKASAAHCIRCHTLTEVGSDARWELSDFKSLELNPEEKLELLVAARKYDQAFQYVEGVITKPGVVSDNPSLFENLLRKYLVLSLRLGKKDFNQTTADLNRVLENKTMPPYLEKQVKAWRDSLATASKNQGEKNFIKAAEKRIAKAKRLQEFAYDHAGDVEYILATDLLHEGLRLDVNRSKQSQIYYLLGLCYEVLGDLGSYNLHETYFEACVRKSPKTKLAQSCYDRLESSLIQGYSGTAGLSLPSEERARLERLKELL